jgi:hypothetical protein
MMEEWTAKVREALEFLEKYPATATQALLDAKEKMEKKRGGR